MECKCRRHCDCDGNCCPCLTSCVSRHLTANLYKVYWLTAATCLCFSKAADASSSNACSVATIFGLKTADCRNRDLQDVPDTMASDMKVLRFTDNRLTYLGIDAFHAYQAMQHLYLGRNRIERIAPDAFRLLHNLQILDLEANRLRTVPTPSFHHITSVRMLSLKSNPITYLVAGAFRPLDSLEELNLENCWLSRVQPAAFTGLSSLGELNLVNNELTGLPVETAPDLPSTLTVLRLHRNPWTCDCRLRWLRRFVDGPPIATAAAASINWDFATHNTPVCSGPELLRGVSWRHLAADQFACAPTQVVGNGSTSVELRAGVNASIDCVVGGDPPPVVTWMKGANYVTADHIKQWTEAASDEAPRLRSVLRLARVSRNDAGDYKCVAVNAAGRSEVTYKVWVVDDISTNDVRVGEKPRDSRGATTSADGGLLFGVGLDVVFGAVIGLIVLIAALFACVVCIVVRRRRSYHSPSDRLKECTPITGNNHHHASPGRLSATRKPDGYVIAADRSETVVATEQRNCRYDLHGARETVADSSMVGSGNSVSKAPRTVPSQRHGAEVKADNADGDADRADRAASDFAMKIFLNDSRATHAPSVPDESSSPPQSAEMTQSFHPLSKSAELLRDSGHSASPPDQPANPGGIEQGRKAEHSRQVDAEADGTALTVQVEGRSSSTGRINDTQGQLPASVVHSSHCANPVCLRDRLLDHRATSSPSPPAAPRAADLCSHRLATMTNRAASPGRGGTRSVAVPQRYSSGNVDDLVDRCRRSPPVVRASPPFATVDRRRVCPRSVDPARCSTLPPGQRPPSEALPSSRYAGGGQLYPGEMAAVGFMHTRTPPPHYGSTLPRRQHGSERQRRRRESHDPAAATTAAWSAGGRLSGSSSALDIRDLETAATALASYGIATPNDSSSTVIATSLHDILSPPFGPPVANGPKPPSGKALRLKPGEQDEFGTAV